MTLSSCSRTHTCFSRTTWCSRIQPIYKTQDWLLNKDMTYKMLFTHNILDLFTFRDCQIPNFCLKHCCFTYKRGIYLWREWCSVPTTQTVEVSPPDKTVLLWESSSQSPGSSGWGQLFQLTDSFISKMTRTLLKDGATACLPNANPPSNTSEWCVPAI